MTLEECYKALGGSYTDVLSRLMNDKMITKYLGKFTEDTSYNDIFTEDTSYNDIFTALANKDYETAFRAAHTLKGLCLNLGLENLYKSAFEVTEALRGKTNETTPEMLEELKTNYESSILAIKQL